MDFGNDQVLEFLLMDFIDEDDVLAAIAEEVGDENRREGNLREIIPVDMVLWRTMRDPTFKDHFRMEKFVFEELVLALGRHLDEHNRISFIRTPLDVALMQVLWILATPDSFRSTGVTFGVSKGVVFFHYTYIIEALREMASTYVTWPGPGERDVIKVHNEDRYGYPGVVGCIDCCHIRVTAPLAQPQRYVNRHHDYSLMVQAVCDHTLLFRDVYVGEPGCVGDVRALARSPLNRNLFGGQGFLEEEEHLLGDGIYTTTDKILSPYLLPGRMNRRQSTHNYILSKCRSAIERAFARLKGKFRRLKYLPSFRLEYAIDHIVACIVLHNFIILEGRKPGLYCDEQPVPCADDVVLDEQVFNHAREMGTYKREYIAELLCPNEE